MQRVFTVDYTADSQFILSGSDDANVRIWKANASKQLGRSKPRQHRKQNYMDQLKARFKHTKEVKSISTHLHVPKLIKKMQSAKRDERGRENSKRKRREDHNKEGVIEKKKERKRMVLKEEE
jgi:WD repeat and SOF domain-containing protein 1